jgi:hypothetical protein
MRPARRSLGESSLMAGTCVVHMLLAEVEVKEATLAVKEMCRRVRLNDLARSETEEEAQAARR